jgi:hypothetical protein
LIYKDTGSKLLVTTILITAKIPYIICGNSFTFALVLLLDVPSISLLIGKMPLKELFGRPVTHVVLKECVVLLGL